MHVLAEGVLGLRQYVLVRTFSRTNCKASLHRHSCRCEGEVLIMDVLRPSARCNERVLVQAKDTLCGNVRRTTIHGLGSANEHR